MYKLRYYIRFIKAFLGRFKTLIFISALIGVASFVLLQYVLPQVVSVKTQKIGVTGRFSPDALPPFILDQVSMGLTKISENGEPEPALAKSWEYRDDGKTWVFTLNTDLKWHDGERLTTKSLNYEFSDVEMTKLDDEKIQFTLKDPFAPFPSAVSKPVFKQGTSLVGIGPWKVQKIELASGVVQTLILEDSQRNRKIYKFYPTVDQTKLAFKLGKVDILENMLDPTPFETWENTTVTTHVQDSQVVVIFFNTKDPLLGDKSIRQALAYAIDKSLFEQRAYGPISPNSWAYNPQVKPYDYDQERAKELLDDVPDELKKSATINLISTPVLLSVAERVKDEWNAAGINTNVQVSSIVPQEFQAYITILDIPSDPDQYSLWHSTQTVSNISQFEAPRIDKLLEDGRSTLTKSDRKKIYLDFQRFLMEDIPAVFLYHPTYYQIVRK